MNFPFFLSTVSCLLQTMGHVIWLNIYILLYFTSKKWSNRNMFSTPNKWIELFRITQGRNSWHLLKAVARMDMNSIRKLTGKKGGVFLDILFNYFSLIVLPFPKVDSFSAKSFSGLWPLPPKLQFSKGRNQTFMGYIQNIGGDRDFCSFLSLSLCLDSCLWICP